MSNLPAVNVPSPPRCPPRFIQRGPLHRIAVTALSIRGEPVVLLAVWARSAAEEDHDDAYSPTSASVAVLVEQLDELVGQVRDAAREARGSS